MERTILTSLVILQTCLCFQYTENIVLKYQGDDDVGQPLILTPYIQNGQLDDGKSEHTYNIIHVYI